MHTCRKGKFKQEFIETNPWSTTDSNQLNSYSSLDLEVKEFSISQLDGNWDNSMISDTEAEVENNVYASNCENGNIILLLSFLRKFFAYWPLTYMNPFAFIAF